MSDIFKEVDDALKQEKVEAIWQKYGNLIIAGILLIIIGTGAYSFYGSWQTSVNEEKTAIIIELQENPDTFDLSKLEALNADQKSLAQFYLAKDHIRAEEYQKAFDTFNVIRQNESANVNIRGLGSYYARNMIIDGQIEGDLSSVPGFDNSIWNNHFKFQEALYLGSLEKKYEEAIKILDQVIIDTTKNQTLQQQAQQLKYVYEFDMQKGQ